MKVSPAQADRFAKAPDPGVRAVLVYGPDAGLVRERAEALVRSVVDDPGDPFRVAQLTGAQLAEDPARLADEAAALALTGGRRVVRIEGVADSNTALLSGFLADPPGEALVVLLAGDLPGRSSLRKVFDAAKLGASVACYRDDQRGLSAVIANTLSGEGLSASPEALAYLAANLGGDRQLTRRELEKLVLYKGEAGGRVELEDALACIGDSADLTLDDLAYAVGAGDMPAMERSLTRSLEEGGHPVAVLRAVARHFQRLHFVAGTVNKGLPLADAMKRLRPPVFWKLAERFKAQSAAWPDAALARALESLLEAEMACKRTGAPAEALAARTLASIAANAPRPGRAPGRNPGRNPGRSGG
jgi:DNA polymerase-3 subunit delta